MHSDFQTLATTVWDAQPALHISAAKKDSVLSLHYHLVFYTEAGVTLSAEWREQFYKVLAGYAGTLGAKATAGGVGNRVDLLVSLTQTANVADFARRVKLLSASWARRKTLMRNFAWRESERIFTVSRSHRRSVEKQITKPIEPLSFYGAQSQLTVTRRCA